MLSLTPGDDVRNKQFATVGLARKGYDEGEVDDFLDEIADTLDQCDATIANLGQRLAVAEHQLTLGGAGAAPRPDAVVGLLAMAQRTASEYVVAAEATAAERIEAADAEARDIVAVAVEESEQVRLRLQASLAQLLDEVAELGMDDRHPRHAV